jgi:Mn-dependent DtxR family transcriptional regulator
MAKPGLSDNERRTLLGIVKYPTLNDRQLSERIGIKMSTVTAIKNRLKDVGFFMTVRVPKLQNMGAEILSISYTHTNPASSENNLVEVGKGLLEGFDELFYVGAGPRYRFSMSMHGNYSSAARVHDSVFDLYSKNDLLIPDDCDIVHFPFDRTKVYNFFDYSRLLEQAFGVKLPDPKVEGDPFDGEFGQTTIVELSRIERKVLRGLTSNPDLLDSNISKRIDVTRQSVTKMRKRFQDLELFFTLRIPNLEMLGFEIFALVHTHFRPTSTMRSRAESLKGIFNDLPIIFKAESDRESIELVATQNYREFEAYYDGLVRPCFSPSPSSSPSRTTSTVRVSLESSMVIDGAFPSRGRVGASERIYI